MENQMQVFNFKDQQVDIIIIDGQPHFIGSQLATILGYTNPQKAVRDHVDAEDKLTERIVLSGQNREVTLINEGGLYALIFSSNLKSSKEFKRWVTHEVLPSIRKTGKYENPQFNRKAGCTFRVGNVDGYFDENGKAFFNLEDTARALGIINTHQKDANGNLYVRWDTIKKMLCSRKYIKPWQKLDREAFIPEDVFYSMVDQARNATAQEFQAIVKAEMPQKEIINNKKYKITLQHLVKDIRCGAEEIEKTFGVSHLTAIDRAIELKEQMTGINLDVLRELLPVDDPVELD